MDEQNTEQEELDLLDILLDEENEDPIVLYDEQGKPTTFDQAAIIPLENKLYCILVPVDEVEGVGEDEGVVFEIITSDTEPSSLNVVVEDEIIDKVFAEYEKLFDEE
ncbi:MAG: DUF1292 domain-containing protein [Clostridia bacterium]|nr:DUF1292 domain-containing protein [Clostridia bacterium]